MVFSQKIKGGGQRTIRAVLTFANIIEKVVIETIGKNGVDQDRTGEVVVVPLPGFTYEVHLVHREGEDIFNMDIKSTLSFCDVMMH